MTYKRNTSSGALVTNFVPLSPILEFDPSRGSHCIDYLHMNKIFEKWQTCCKVKQWQRIQNNTFSHNCYRANIFESCDKDEVNNSDNYKNPS